MGRIRYLVMDVDGTLTDGKIYIGSSGELMKAFDIKDGYGIHTLLPANGIKPVIITGRESLIVARRAEELRISSVFQGVGDKVTVLRKFVSDEGGDLSQVAYIGDDLNDIPCMRVVKASGGVVACPADSVKEVLAEADYVCNKNGGEGAVRELIDSLLAE